MKKNINFLYAVLCFFTVLALTTASAAVIYDTMWGFSGDGTVLGGFSLPQDVDVDKTGRVYVADTGNNKIQIFDSNGTGLTSFGSTGIGINQFMSPKGIAIDRFDDCFNVFVIENVNNRGQKFVNQGTTLATTVSFGSGGPLNGQFTYPSGIAAFSVKTTSTPVTTGTLSTVYTIVAATIITTKAYVADTGNNRVQRFDTGSTLTTTTRVTSAGTTPLTAVTATSTTPAFVTFVGTTLSTEAGNGNGKFSAPEGVAVDSLGYIYVSDTGNNRIQMFDQNGIYVNQWGGLGTSNGKFDTPRGLAMNVAGTAIYIADSANQRIQKLSTTSGTFLTSWGTSGTGAGQFANPSGVAVDNAGNIYVADRNNNRIQKFHEIADIPPVPPAVAGPQILKIVGGTNGYVNPALGDTCSIKFQAGFAGAVKISIFNAAGVLVRTITGLTSDGSTLSTYIYDCKDDTGRVLATGIYTVKIEGPTLNLVKKLGIAR